MFVKFIFCCPLTNEEIALYCIGQGQPTEDPNTLIDSGSSVADALVTLILNQLNPTNERKPTMKNFLFATAAAFALLAAPAFADTFKVFGVETKAVAGSNYTVKVNPNDVIVMTGGNDTGTDAFFTQGVILVLAPLVDN